MLKFIDQTSALPAAANDPTRTTPVILGSDHAGFALKEKPGQTPPRIQGIPCEDVGTPSPESVDYPDFARTVADPLGRHPTTRGILVCGTGIGISIAANRNPAVRAALCHCGLEARLAREHNDANVLCLGGGGLRPGPGRAPSSRPSWTPLSPAAATSAASTNGYATRPHGASPPPIPRSPRSILSETRRQSENIELIASENFTSRAVMETMGSTLTNKYAEGYPRKRWYGGCEFVDGVEQLAIDRAKRLFGAEHANVQPHSGSGANMAVYFAVLKPGDTILTMDLSHGGHLTHGHPRPTSPGSSSRSSTTACVQEDERIDYDQLAAWPGAPARR